MQNLEYYNKKVFEFSYITELHLDGGFSKFKIFKPTGSSLNFPLLKR